MLDNGFKVHIEVMFYNYINFTLMIVSKIGHPFRTMKEMHTLTLQTLIHALLQVLVVDLNRGTCQNNSSFFVTSNVFKKILLLDFSLSYLLIF
jgi:hypothetical protein